MLLLVLLCKGQQPETNLTSSAVLPAVKTLDAACSTCITLEKLLYCHVALVVLPAVTTNMPINCVTSEDLLCLHQA